MLEAAMGATCADTAMNNQLFAFPIFSHLPPLLSSFRFCLTHICPAHLPFSLSLLPFLSVFDDTAMNNQLFALLPSLAFLPLFCFLFSFLFFILLLLLFRLHFILSVFDDTAMSNQLFAFPISSLHPPSLSSFRFCLTHISPAHLPFSLSLPPSSFPYGCLPRFHLPPPPILLPTNSSVEI